MSAQSPYREAIAATGVVLDQQQQVVVDRLVDLTERLARPEVNPRRRWFGRAAAVKGPERGVYVWGGVGRGKTWLMDLFFQTLSIERKERLHFHHFMKQTHEDLRELSGQANPLDRVASKIARRTRVLCLDEFVVTDIGDAVILARLLNALFRLWVTLVTTSNVAPENLYRDGIQRASFLPAIDLLETHTEVVRLDGGRDYRREILTAASVYHVPLGADTDRRLLTEFEELVKEDYERDGQLDVLRRSIPFRCRAGSIVWFDFIALCGPPRSQHDYIEVARCHHTVLISDVPRMDGSTDDCTRRFILLIDEFYDRKVKLIVSAAVDPERLYCGERLAFEFQRTASRLIEMQSQEYLAQPHAS